MLHLATLQCGRVCIVQTSVLVDRGAVASRAAAARLVGYQLVCTRPLHHGHGRGALLRRLADAGGDHLALARVSQQFAADWLHIRCVLLQSRGRDAIDATEANLRRSALAAPEQPIQALRRLVQQLPLLVEIIVNLSYRHVLL